MRWVLLVGLGLGVAGCVSEGTDDTLLDGPDDSFVVDGAADAYGVVDGSPEACAVLRLVNTGTQDALRQATRSGLVALHIMQVRAGDDGAVGTSDDRTIDSLAALDAIPYVGPRAFERLVAFSADPQYSSECGATGSTRIATPWGTSLTPQELCSLLRVVNELTERQLDYDVELDTRLAQALVAARPIATLEQLDAVPRFAGSALTSVFNYLASHPELACSAAPAASCTGGTYDGVEFSAAEACKTVDFMNNARWSQMEGLTATLRRIVYFEVPGGVTHPSPGYRAALWRSVADVVPFASSTSMRALKDSAQAWTRGGPRYDTIADTWANRVAMDGKPVLFERVFVVRAVSRPSATWSSGQYFCHELRDDSTRPNWMNGCVLWVNADSSPRCGNEACLDEWIGRFVQVRGTVRRVGTSYRINLSTDEPVAASPAP